MVVVVVVGVVVVVVVVIVVVGVVVLGVEAVVMGRLVIVEGRVVDITIDSISKLFSSNVLCVGFSLGTAGLFDTPDGGTMAPSRAPNGGLPLGFILSPSSRSLGNPSIGKGRNVVNSGNISPVSGSKSTIDVPGGLVANGSLGSSFEGGGSSVMADAINSF